MLGTAGSSAPGYDALAFLGLIKARRAWRTDFGARRDLSRLPGSRRGVDEAGSEFERPELQWKPWDRPPQLN